MKYEFKLYGWYNKEKKSLSFVYSSELQVKMCSSDYFESAIERGEGEIVKIKAFFYIKKEK